MREAKEIVESVEKQLNDDGILQTLKSQLKIHVLQVLTKKDIMRAPSARKLIITDSKEHEALKYVKELLDLLGMKHTSNMLITELDGLDISSTREELLLSSNIPHTDIDSNDAAFIQLIDYTKQISAVANKQPKNIATLTPITTSTSRIVLSSLPTKPVEATVPESTSFKVIESSSKYIEKIEPAPEPEPVVEVNTRSSANVKKLGKHAVFRSKAGWDSKGDDDIDDDDENDEISDSKEDDDDAYFESKNNKSQINRLNVNKEEEVPEVHDIEGDDEFDLTPPKDTKSLASTNVSWGEEVTTPVAVPSAVDTKKKNTSYNPNQSITGGDDDGQFDYVIDENSGDETDKWGDKSDSFENSSGDFTRNKNTSAAGVNTGLFKRSEPPSAVSSKIVSDRTVSVSISSNQLEDYDGDDFEDLDKGDNGKDDEGAEAEDEGEEDDSFIEESIAESFEDVVSVGDQATNLSHSDDYQHLPTPSLHSSSKPSTHSLNLTKAVANVGTFQDSKNPVVPPVKGEGNHPNKPMLTEATSATRNFEDSFEQSIHSELEELEMSVGVADSDSAGNSF